jgi:hypothetical protein
MYALLYIYYPGYYPYKTIRLLTARELPSTISNPYEFLS